MKITLDLPSVLTGGAVALVLGLVFSGFALVFIRRRDRHAARNLFFASIVYLPVLLGLLVATKR